MAHRSRAEANSTFFAATEALTRLTNFGTMKKFGRSTS